MDISEIPGEIVMDEAGLPEAVMRAAGNSGSRSLKSKPHELKKFMERYMGAWDGHSTERIAEWMRLQNGSI